MQRTLASGQVAAEPAEGEGMGSKDAAPFDDGDTKLWKRVLDTRAAVATLAILFGSVLGTVGPNAVATVLVVAAYLIFQTIRFRRVKRFEAYIPVSDMVVAGSFAWLRRS